MIVRDLRTVLASAVEDGALVQSPARRIALPELDREPVVPLEVDQVARLADAIAPRYRALVLLGAGTGLRLGELYGHLMPDSETRTRAVVDAGWAERSRGLPADPRVETRR